MTVGHVVQKRVYILVFLTLLALTGLTTGVAFIDLGPWNTVVALVIAVCKASLVALFFMHLWWSAHLMRLVIVSSLLWLAILIGFTLSDFLTRNWIPAPTSWQTTAPAPQNPRREPMVPTH